MNSNASEATSVSSGPESSHHLLHAGKSLITTMTDIVSTRAKRSFPKIATGAALVWFGAVSAVLAIAWLSFFAYEQLKMNTALQTTASAAVGGLFLLISSALIAGGKTKTKNAFKLEDEATLDPAPDAEELKTELVTFSEDLGRAAKEALDPRRFLRANAGKITIAAAAFE